MSDRGRAAQISLYGVQLLATEATLKAFPELLPNLSIRAFVVVGAECGEEPMASAVPLIHEAKSEVLMNGGLHADETMHSGTFKTSPLRMARRIRSPHRAADMYPGKRRRRLCRLGR